MKRLLSDKNGRKLTIKEEKKNTRTNTKELRKYKSTKRNKYS